MTNASDEHVNGQTNERARMSMGHPSYYPKRTSTITAWMKRFMVALESIHWRLESWFDMVCSCFCLVVFVFLFVCLCFCVCVCVCVCLCACVCVCAWDNRGKNVYKSFVNTPLTTKCWFKLSKFDIHCLFPNTCSTSFWPLFCIFSKKSKCYPYSPCTGQNLYLTR